jgi:predicted amidophosphoribosyltransferase
MGVTSTTCASCGAVLAETDRFCPACDVPNTSKPFPKFRPHVADLREEGDPVRVPAEVLSGLACR